MASDQAMVDEENFDPELRVIGFDGATPYEVFSQATAWLGARDGAVGVFTVSMDVRACLIRQPPATDRTPPPVPAPPVPQPAAAPATTNPEHAGRQPVTPRAYDRSEPDLELQGQAL